VPSGATDVPRAILIAEKLLETLEEPFTVAGQPVEVGASIGIAIYPQHGDDAATLMGRADVAMYVAKQARSGYSLYTGEQDSPMRPLTLVTKLRSAIEQFELILHYQPIVDLQTGSPLRAEALVRWGHPRHGLIQPDDFIPAAEQSDLIKPLTLWVLNEALSQLQTWRKAGLDLGVTVNLSGRTLLDPEFPDTTRQLLETWAISPDLLTLEITERSMLAAAEDEAGGRFWDRLRVPGAPEASGAGRDQNRPLVRDGHGGQPRRRHHRAFHHRPGAQPGDSGRRGRGGKPGDLGTARGARL